MAAAVDPSADHCVRGSCRTPTVCGSGAKNHKGTDGDVGDRVLGRDTNIALFGDTPEEQQDWKEKESHAWYDLIQTSNIISHTNVQVDFDREETFLQSVMWC